MRCCVLVKVLSNLESETESRDALLVICQTALLHNWLHPEDTEECRCIEVLNLYLYFKLRHEPNSIYYSGNKFADFIVFASFEKEM